MYFHACTYHALEISVIFFSSGALLEGRRTTAKGKAASRQPHFGTTLWEDNVKVRLKIKEPGFCYRHGDQSKYRPKLEPHPDGKDCFCDQDVLGYAKARCTSREVCPLALSLAGEVTPQTIRSVRIEW